MYNIVIVEDEYIESESLKRIISRCVENSVIHEAATGRKAIQLIDQLGQIDMMFVDINIPLPNGNQVIEYLKQKNTQTKVIVTTANDDFEIVRHMLSLKVDDYLLKPVKQSILSDTIRKTLLVDEQEATLVRELRQKIGDLIGRCDYPGWHSFYSAFLTRHAPDRLWAAIVQKRLPMFLSYCSSILRGLARSMFPAVIKLPRLFKTSISRDYPPAITGAS